MHILEVKQGECVIEQKTVNVDRFVNGSSVIDLKSCGKTRVFLNQTTQINGYEIQIVPQSPGHDPGVSSPVHLPPISADEVIPQRADDPWEQAPAMEGFIFHEVLGQGGMGTVWRATQLSLHRQVALKMIRGGIFGNARARMRFDREVELLGRLEHPNIARLYHADLHRGCCYYVMQLIEGIPLDEYVQQNNLTPRQILQLMQKICHVVQYAHQRGVIHRDLKPNNILVSADGQPHVLDFGLAKTIEQPQGQEYHTLEGSLAGTLAYMAPEQARGDIENIDTRTDVYALGVMLYQLLLGQLPHNQEGMLLDIQKRITDGEPVRPRTVEPSFNRELEAILLKTLSRRAEHRYPSAGDLADDIDHYLHSEPITARRHTAAYVFGKFIIKHKRLVLSIAAVLVLVAAIAVVAYVDVRRSRDAAEKSAYIGRIKTAFFQMEKGDYAEALKDLEHCPERYRNWEWYWLRHQLDQSVATFQSDRTITDYSLSKDEKRLYTVDARGTIQTWDIAENRIIAAFHAGEKHPKSRSIAGKHALAFLATERSVAVWDMEKQQAIQTIHTDNKEIYRVSLSSDENTLFIHCTSGEVAVWDVQNVQQLCVLAGLGNAQWIDADDTGIVVVSGHKIALYPKSNGQLLHEREMLDSISARAIDAESKQVYLSSGEKIVTLDSTSLDLVFSADVAKPYRILEVNKAEDNQIYAAHDDHTIELLDVATGAMVHSFHSADQYLMGIKSARYSDRFYSRNQRSIRQWEKAHHVDDFSLKLSSEDQFCLTSAFDTEHGRFVAAASNGDVIMLDLATGEQQVVAALGTPVFLIGINAEENQIVAADTKDIYTIHISTGAVSHRLSPDIVWAVSGNGQWIVVQKEQDSDALVILNAASFREVRQLTGAVAVAFSSNSRFMVMYSAEHGVQVWDTQNWRLHRSFEGISGEVQAITVSGDGNVVALADRLGQISILRDGGGSLETLRMRGAANNLFLLLNGRGDRMWMVGSRTVLWDTITLDQLLVLDAGQTLFLSASADQRHVAIHVPGRVLFNAISEVMSFP